MGWYCHVVCVSIPLGQPDPNLIANANPDPPTPADREVPTYGWCLVIVPYGLVCLRVTRVLLSLSLTLTQTPLPQLTNLWLVLGDSTLWAGFVPSSVFQFRLANPTLTLSRTLTQIPLPQLTARPIHGWRLVIGPCGLVMCACRTRAAVVCVVVLDSKMVGFHGKPLCFSGSIYADRFSNSACAGRYTPAGNPCIQ